MSSQLLVSKRSQNIFEDLFDASPDATIVVGEGGAIAYASAQCESLLGYTSAELIGQTIELLVPVEFRQGHPGLRSNFFQQSRPRPMGGGRQLAAQCKNGKTIPIEVSLSPIQSDGQALVAAALRDVSDRIAVQNRLRDALEDAESATRMKTRFLAAASHDLRQPLQSISAYTSVLEARTSDPEQLDLVAKIHASISGMSEILNTLLDVSQLDAGQIEPKTVDFSLSAMFEKLDEVYRPKAETKGLEFYVTHNGLDVHTDPALLERVLENFVSNAIKYTETGSVHLNACAHDNGVQIDVKDSGMGIPEDDQSIIFEEYVQLSNPTRDASKGLGIGLALVRRLTKLLDVELSLDSTPGIGSTFSVILPASQVEYSIEEGTVISIENEEKNSKIKLILVEDNEAILDSVTMLLDLEGFEVRPATSSVDVDAHIENGFQPDIIVSDFRLPTKNGIDVVRQARIDLQRNLPAIIITGDTSATEIESANLDRCVVLHKPTKPGEIAAQVRELVEQND